MAKHVKDLVLIFSMEDQRHPIQTINGIKFTPREIDILAAILSGRAAKGMASLLDISLKTLEGHIHNVMGKFACNARESVRVLLENSDHSIPLRNHYLSLRLQEIFKKSLKKATLLLKAKKPRCFLVYPQTNLNRENGPWVLKGYETLQGFLQSLGIEEVLIPLKDHKDVVHHIQDTLKKAKREERYFYFIDETLLSTLEGALGDLENSTDPQNIFLLLPKDHLALDALEDKEHKPVYGYFFVLWQILEKLFPEVDFKELIQAFREQYDDLLDKNYQNVDISSDLASDALLGEGGQDTKFASLQQNRTMPHKTSKDQVLRHWVFAATGIAILVWVAMVANERSVAPKDTATNIRSELLIPHDSIFLKRPYVLKQMEEKLQGKGGIQKIVLIGLGGSGKTTMARHYARSHTASLVWEINAESKQTLLHSFKNLAYVLASTKEKKDALNFIQGIQDPDLREKQLLAFIKQHLREAPNWLLIYDNAESFETIKDYFPYDAAAWGSGKVIITTQDKHIRNASEIHPQNIMKVEALKAEERGMLFKSIIGKDDPTKAWKLLHKIPNEFLGKIPPFPLDVAMAAYYMKDIQIPYQQYLDTLYTFDATFETLQRNILKTIGSYQKTRYGIISGSFQKIININPEFKELLLFITSVRDYLGEVEGRFFVFTGISNK